MVGPFRLAKAANSLLRSPHSLKSRLMKPAIKQGDNTQAKPRYRGRKRRAINGAVGEDVSVSFHSYTLSAKGRARIEFLKSAAGAEQWAGLTRIDLAASNQSLR